MILINGKTGTQIDIADRGLQYGDGLFETIAVNDGACPYLDYHLQRLAQGCERLHLNFRDAAPLRGEIGRLAAGQRQAVIKVIVTRGAGARGYRPAAGHTCTRVVARYSRPDYPQRWKQEGIRVRLCRTRLGINPALAGLKHLNRLEQVLARAEWDDPDIAEGVMLDTGDRVIEGTMSNVFLARGGELMTPRMDQAGVAGVMRRIVLENASRLGLACRETSVTLDVLRGADELLMCNSLAGIWPVRLFEEQTFPVGPVTRKLLVELDSYYPEA